MCKAQLLQVVTGGFMVWEKRGNRWYKVDFFEKKILAKQAYPRAKLGGPPPDPVSRKHVDN